MSQGPISVGRVRVQDVRRDPLATRVALERLLATAALRPRGLPPAAILVVRTLEDPLPRRLRLDRADIRPPPEWEHAVAASLDDLGRHAARPAHEAVPANAAAVLFADRAELLACLLADWVAGAVAARWWWRLVVRGDPTARVPAELRASPTYVPAVFALLAERGTAVAVAASLPPDEALAIARSVAAAFGVRVPEVDGARGEERPSAAVAAVAPAGVVSPEHDTPSAASAAPARAAELLLSVPEARAPGLRAEQRTLLAVALGLRRTPATLRLFAEPTLEEPPLVPPPTSAPRPPKAAAPEPGASNGLSLGGPERVEPPLLRVGGPAAAPRDAALPQGSTHAGQVDFEPAPDGAEPEAAAPSSPPAATGLPEQPPVDAKATREASADPPAGRPELVARTHPPAATPVPPPRTPKREPDSARPPTPEVPPVAPRATRESEPDALRLFGPAIETRLGGLFFLVNVGIDLGLYGDFTQPARPGIALDLWDFVTLAGHELLRVADDDPVWTLLAELAGRDPDEPPGAGFVPPAGATFAAWTAGVLDEIRAVLAAVELDPERLVRRPATVHVTEAHVDVVFALAGHPLEIRIAGLDRDPGFVPAAGRHVSFHFE